MTRPFARKPRKVKEPPVPVTYEESDAVRHVAERLIRLFPARFGWTTNFRIGYQPLNATAQEALVAHELCHGEMTEKGTLRVVPHDLEEFRFVVAQWGP